MPSWCNPNKPPGRSQRRIAVDEVCIGLARHLAGSKQFYDNLDDTSALQKRSFTVSSTAMRATLL